MDPEHIWDVGAPYLVTYNSFEKAVRAPNVQLRLSRAKAERPIIKERVVLGYSFTLDRLRFDLGDLTLDVFAMSPVVEWSIQDKLPPLEEDGQGVLLLRTVEYGNKIDRFDRREMLEMLMGKRIVHSPCETGIFIQWGYDLEFGCYSLPVKDDNRWILRYS